MSGRTVLLGIFCGQALLQAQPTISTQCLKSVHDTGRREFGDFLAEYAGAIPGTFVDVESGEALGSCANLAAVTHGQGAGISGLPER